MTSTTIFWVSLALLSIVALGFAWLTWRCERDGELIELAHDDSGNDWFRALMFTLCFFAILAFLGQIHHRVLEHEAGASAIRHPPSALVAARAALTARELTKGFGQCPPRGEGMTDIVTLVIKTSADNGPEVITCIRYAERPFVPKRRPAARG